MITLLSYLVLPVQYSRKHYLNTCLMLAISLLDLGFIVTLAAKPEQCYDEITPNDMYSSTACAWSGAFILAGGLSAVAWVFVRALSMHLQICWDVTPGRKFFYWAQVLGWVFPAALFVAAITSSGVSFRFGPAACHINHNKSMLDFWGWLLAIAGVAIVIQLCTLGYCLNVYLRNLWTDDDDLATQASEGRAPTLTPSSRTQTVRPCSSPSFLYCNLLTSITDQSYLQPPEAHSLAAMAWSSHGNLYPHGRHLLLYCLCLP